MTKFSAGDSVYIPTTLLPAASQSLVETALFKTTIVDANPVPGSRSVTVELPKPKNTPNWSPPPPSPPIGSSRAIKTLGVAVFSLEDLEGEASTFEPLRKSVLHYLRLLLPEDSVRSWRIRSLAELQWIWFTFEPTFTHVIILAHGDKDSLMFDIDGEVKSAEVINSLYCSITSPKVFMLSACNTGISDFAEQLSASRICSHLIAPRQTIHAAQGALFYQGMFHQMLMLGRTTKTAFNKTLASFGGSANGSHHEPFLHWQNGQTT